MVKHYCDICGKDMENGVKCLVGIPTLIWRARMKAIFVNSHASIMRHVKDYMYGILNSMNARRVPMGQVDFKMYSGKGGIIQTSQLIILIYPAGTDMRCYPGMADEAFYFDAETSKYLYGNRYSERYCGNLIDYIVEVEGGMPRDKDDGKEFIHEYDL